ncbi:conserved hypothetical protein [Vibrio crassostreae]|uniref:Uncharacterized protein n=1 Tax=Vibrio crassostreae TaxID=246167 RepID=A0A822MZY3_9VIBR|nr:hypothetical protein [Vibrio crassostreae]MDH5948955.1 hypothetical protein [Vibrio crassostreae]TCN11319.1 hypothetical protein EDB35_103189 [Vibrio crassostreae]TCU10795.1 hypothetical protein EDB32_103189 [Vibrio crassostreae]CAK1860836.1 conserved hypothetical protein [Vibrio crassostreae]CAK1967282.1 conserved hypothetical protein [Vibrio crassostreae]
MYLVLYCHNIGMTDFSFFETEDFDKEDGYIVRGKWPNEKAFRDYLTKEFGDMSEFRVIDLIAKGVEAEHYSPEELMSLAL